MTRQDFFIKWGVYALALLPVWFCELYLLNRFPLFGVSPMLLPLAAMADKPLTAFARGGAAAAFRRMARRLLGQPVPLSKEYR